MSFLSLLSYQNQSHNHYYHHHRNHQYYHYFLHLILFSYSSICHFLNSYCCYFYQFYCCCYISVCFFVIVLSIIDVIAVVVVLKYYWRYFSWGYSFPDLVFGTLSLSGLLLWYTVESHYSFAHFNVYLMRSFLASFTMPAFSLLVWTLKPKCITFCFPDGKFLRLPYLLRKSKLWRVLAKPHFKSKNKGFVPISNA